MIDFHSHIIYGIDDGAKDIETSLRMLLNAGLERTEFICATPHFIPGSYEVTREKYSEKLQELQRKSPLKIISGMEVYIDVSLPYLYKEGKIWGINEGPYMLIEFPMRDIPKFTEHVIHELSVLGVKPVIAHPERNLKFISNPVILERFIDEGYLLQLNTGSLTGMYGNVVQKTAETLVKRNMIHLLGSDGHDDVHRKTDIRKGSERLRELNPALGEWIEENGRRIMSGDTVELPETRKSRRSVFDIFRKKY